MQDGQPPPLHLLKAEMGSENLLKAASETMESPEMVLAAPGGLASPRALKTASSDERMNRDGFRYSPSYSQGQFSKEESEACQNRGFLVQDIVRLVYMNGLVYLSSPH